MSRETSRQTKRETVREVVTTSKNLLVRGQMKGKVGQRRRFNVLKPFADGKDHSGEKLN